MTKNDNIYLSFFFKSVAGEVANTGFEGALPQMFLECPLDFYA